MIWKASGIVLIMQFTHIESINLMVAANLFFTEEWGNYPYETDL